ncbi:MAG: response regulator [Ignavibacteriae bacterium]|nr:MAG: response regulator [Ignavibacteriota bacterium]
MESLKRILIVEDNENDLELTLDTLTEYNLANNVDVARDGEEALDYLFKKNKFSARDGNNPIVILLDIKLPKINGLEVLKTIRNTDGYKKIPVVILTSSREEKDLNEGYTLGVNAYVVKPVEFNSFADAIKSLGIFWAIVNEPPPKTIS